MRSRRVFIGHILLLVVLMAHGAAVAGSYEDFGDQQRTTENGEGLSEVLYKINDDLLVTRADFEMEKNAIKLNIDERKTEVAQNKNLLPSVRKKLTEAMKMPSDSSILDDLIDDLVILAEAKEQGIVVTEADATKFLDESSQRVKDSSRNGTPEERAEAKAALDRFDAFLKGMGMTEKEYRAKIQVPGAIKMLTIAAMKEQYQKSIGAQNLTSEEFASSFKQYANGLRKKYPSIK